MIKFLPAVIICGLIVYIVLFSPVFKIKNITFDDPASCVDTQAINNNLLGKNILFVNTSQIKNNIADNLHCGELAKISKNLPSSLNFQMKVENAVAKVDGSGLSLTQSGLFENADNNSNNPTIYLPQQITIQLGKKVEDSNVLAALKIASGLEKSDFIPANIRFSENNSIAVYSSQKFVVIFSAAKDVTEQIDSLQAILAKAKINASKIAKIDLQFDKPVIVYEKVAE